MKFNLVEPPSAFRRPVLINQERKPTPELAASSAPPACTTGSPDQCPGEALIPAVLDAQGVSVDQTAPQAEDAEHEEDQVDPAVPDPLEITICKPWDDSSGVTHHDLVKSNGDPFIIEGKSLPPVVKDWNVHYWAARYAHVALISFDAESSKFYGYEEPSGVWRIQRNQELRFKLAKFLLDYAGVTKQVVLSNKRSQARLGEMVSALQAHARPLEGYKGKQNSVLHLGNGMLHLDCSPPELRPFSPAYFSRMQCPIQYDPTATSPRFINDLILSAIDKDDADLLQHFCGLFLLGRNIFQVFLIFKGIAGSGKGTIERIIRAIIGEHQVIELRPRHLTSKFEFDNLSDVSLFVGSDVNANFLSEQGASRIKALTGGDILTSEQKGGGKRGVVGEHNVLITTNCDLQIKLQGDGSAWKRRMHIIEFDRALSKSPLMDFDKVLMQQEGSGILNWFIEGAVKVLKLSRDGQPFPVTARQTARVDKLLEASDCINHFVAHGLRPQKGSNMTSVELFDAYENFCAKKGWVPKSEVQVQRELPRLLKEHHKVIRGNDMERGGKDVRGYRHIARVISADENATDNLSPETAS